MDQYLKRYAEPETSLLTSLEGTWQQALIIPAYRETAAFLDQSLPDNCVLIAVLNRPPDDADTAWAQLVTRSLPEAVWQQSHLSLHQRRGNSSVLLVDRCIHGQPVPAHQGVGLARKIGADIACQLLATGQLRSPWLACSDADACLPPGYWAALERSDDSASACVFPFVHERGTATTDAVRRYELHMLYYLAGLRFAGSPYAWPTIGSCIAINAYAYAQVRGYPKKSGGEDFYLLNKLAKLGGIRHLSGPQIALSARLSDRVPFGTGPALQKIHKLESPDRFCSYHPQSFVYLKAALDGLKLAAHSDGAMSTETAAHMHSLDAAWFSQFWQQAGCDQAIVKARSNSRSVAQMQRQLMTWFDAFRSLKWIHACRSRLPDLPLDECLEKATWLTIPATRFTSLDQHLASLHNHLADNSLRGPGIIQTNEATDPQNVNICGQ